LSFGEYTAIFGAFSKVTASLLEDGAAISCRIICAFASEII